MPALENALYRGDNLEVMRPMPDGFIDLIYIDPPFFSNQNYEVIWGDGAELRAFEDRWKGGINVYVEWMVERLREMHRLLKPTGSIYVHLDWHAVHYIKVEMDKIFGRENFVTEIIWHMWTAHGAKGVKSMPKVHQTLLLYRAGDTPTYNPEFRPYRELYLERARTDPDGRHWVDQNLGKLKPDTIERLKQEGRVFVTTAGKLRRKQYLDEMPGEIVGDVWVDIRSINPQARERLGYPTQKPEALLDRIIRASSNEGDLVADFFCSCGTALVVAQKLRRRWLGCDVSPTALRVVRERLNKAGATSGMPPMSTYDLDLGEEELRTLQPFEFQNYVLNAIHATHARTKTADRGVDGYTYLERLPIQVKQRDGVGRPDIQKFHSAVMASGKEKGLFIAFGYSRQAHEEAARIKHDHNIEIELKTVKELLEE